MFIHKDGSSFGELTGIEKTQIFDFVGGKDERCITTSNAGQTAAYFAEGSLLAC